MLLVMLQVETGQKRREKEKGTSQKPHKEPLVQAVVLLVQLLHYLFTIQQGEREREREREQMH